MSPGKREVMEAYWFISRNKHLYYTVFSETESDPTVYGIKVTALVGFSGSDPASPTADEYKTAWHAALATENGMLGVYEADTAHEEIKGNAM